MHVYKYIFICIYIFICTHIYIYIYIYIHICIHVPKGHGEFPRNQRASLQRGGEGGLGAGGGVVDLDASAGGIEYMIDRNWDLVACELQVFFFCVEAIQDFLHQNWQFVVCDLQVFLSEHVSTV